MKNVAKRGAVVVLFSSLMVVGFFVVEGQEGAAQDRVVARETPVASSTPDSALPDVNEGAEMVCTHNSECSHGGCSNGRCGSCTHNSECDGWGGCSGGWCGSCSNNSDCGSFGPCNSGRCGGSPY